MSSQGQQLTVTIEKMAIGGAGIARAADGLVIFVADSAPGDQLLVEIITKKKRFAEAKILKMLVPGPSRRDPPCPIADRCGGCNWQHIQESEQRVQKQQMVEELLKKFLPGQNLPFFPLKESPRSLRYRNRIQPKYLRGQFGFFGRRSHEVIAANDCLITEEKLTASFPQITSEMDRKFRDSPVTQRLELYLDENENPRWLLMGEEKEGIGFSQVNRFQNLDLIQTVLDWSGGMTYDRIFDLYAGAGNFTFPLAEKYSTQQLIAAELDSKLVRRANEKAQEIPGLNKRIQFHHRDVAEFMKTSRFQPKDLILLDPPRAGADEYVMTSLAKSPVAKIIYISCHPASLARDLKYFFAAQEQTSSSRKLKLTRIQCFEMFPQTDHVETIAELAVDTPQASE